GGDGQSWSSAFQTLQDALACVRNEAESGEACEGVSELWIAEGVYYPDQGGGMEEEDPEASFTLVEGVSLYGGLAGSEDRRDQRDPEANVTILSGDVTDKETSLEDPFPWNPLK